MIIFNFDTSQILYISNNLRQQNIQQLFFLKMNNLFLTTVPSQVSPRLTATQRNTKIDNLIDSLKNICERLQTQDKLLLLNITNKLNLDKTILKITKQFSKQITIDRQQPQLLTKLQRKYGIMRIIDKQVTIHKNLAKKAHQHTYCHPKKPDHTKQTIEKQIVQQMKYRLLVDKNRQNSELKRKQELRSHKVSYLKAQNKYKMEIYEKQKQKQLMKFDEAIQAKSKIIHEDYSIWNNYKNKNRKLGQRFVLTSMSKKRSKNTINQFNTKQNININKQTNRQHKKSPNLKNWPNKTQKSSKSLLHRKQAIQKQKQSFYINRTMQKLIKISNLSADKKNRKPKSNKYLLNRFDNQATLLQRQNCITHSIQQKCLKKNNILRDRSNQIHQSLTKKQQKIINFKQIQDQKNQNYRQQINKYHQLVKQKQLKKKKQQNMHNLYQQQVLKRRHYQALQKGKNYDRIVDLMHLSDSQLQNYVQK